MGDVIEFPYSQDVIWDSVCKHVKDIVHEMGLPSHIAGGFLDSFRPKYDLFVLFSIDLSFSLPELSSLSQEQAELMRSAIQRELTNYSTARTQVLVELITSELVLYVGNSGL